jgi:hypothetical protein
MQQLLAWPGSTTNIHDYKMNDRHHLQYADDYELARTRIKKTNDGNTTETQDNYIDYWNVYPKHRSAKKPAEFDPTATFAYPRLAEEYARARHFRTSYDDHYNVDNIHTHAGLHDALYLNYLENLGRSPADIWSLFGAQTLPHAGGGDPVPVRPQTVGPVHVVDPHNPPRAPYQEHPQQAPASQAHPAHHSPDKRLDAPIEGGDLRTPEREHHRPASAKETPESAKKQREQINVRRSPGYSV